MTWIRRTTRVRIFLRDAFTCVWCGRAFGLLTLDHVKPKCRGVNHSPKNLVTACLSCNSARQEKSVREFALFLGRRGVEKRVRNAVRRQLPARKVAQAILGW